jgi:cyclopropane fatty-acyl-phospholipid synthase-like methyltransferase
VVGLDLAHSALVRASEAARNHGLPAYFCLADVADLGLLNVQASFVLDVGCFHAVAPERRSSYIASLAAHLSPGAFYLLYVFTPSWEGEEGPRGIDPADIGRFAPDLVLRWGRHGQDRERSSAWYLLQRS